MTAGRPTDYDAEKVAKQVAGYVKSCHAKNYLPTVEGLAVHLSVGRTTIYRWSEEHEEFRYILEQLLAAQASQLIQNSLVGHYNSTIAKLLLTKHRGADNKPYSDKVETDITTGGDKINLNVISYGDTTPTPVHPEAVPDTSTESAG